jgi:hypothetical protein
MVVRLGLPRRTPEIKRLKKEVAELRRANDDPQGSIDFLRGRARPATAALVRFIDEHKDRTDGGRRWGVESICRRPFPLVQRTPTAPPPWART